MTALPRTPDEILARMAEVKQEDFFGTIQTDLIQAVPYAQAQPFLNVTTTEEDWPDATVETVTEEARAYLGFAMGKASDHRGLSAGRSVDHYRAWMWLLGKDGEVDWTNFTNYGAPILRQIAEVMGWNDHWQACLDPGLERMAQGLPCDPAGCVNGCGQ